MPLTEREISYLKKAANGEGKIPEYPTNPTEVYLEKIANSGGTGGDTYSRAQVDEKLSEKANKADVQANTAAIEVLNGDGEGSVNKTVTDKVAEIVADAPEDFDTLKEMSDWIAEHKEDASAMNSAILENTAAIEANATEIEKKANTADFSNVGNFKAVSTVASQGLSDTEKANARANINALSTVGNAASASKLTAAVRVGDTSGVSNKYAKIAVMTNPTKNSWGIWGGKTIKLFVADAANGNLNSELYIHARASGTVGEYVFTPTLRVNSLKYGKSMFFLMYTGWTVELWCKCPSTDVCNVEIFEECSDDSVFFPIEYVKPLSWQTDAPTSGTRVNAVNAFINYAPRSCFGICSTGSETAAKTVSVDDFVLGTGSRVSVKFTNGALSSGQTTLNVSGTGAKVIAVEGDVADRHFQCRANQVCDFVYDGTYWNLI